MYSAYKLNKPGDSIQPRCTPFPVWNQSFVFYPVLTVASWSAYRFFRRQVRWSGIPITWRIFQFVVIHTVKGFGIINKAEVDVFLELACFSIIQQMLAIWSLVPLPFLKPAWTSESSLFTYCWSSVSKESAFSAGDTGLIPGLERSSGEGTGSPLQYSCLENSMDGGAW